jgi:hypothetical protein
LLGRSTPDDIAIVGQDGIAMAAQCFRDEI